MAKTRQEELIKRQSSKPGLRGRINAMCISCIFDEKSGNGKWMEQVQKCNSIECPLYDVRPKSIRR